MVPPPPSAFSHINDAALKVRLHYMLINTFFLGAKILSGLLGFSVSVAGDSQCLDCLRVSRV